MKMPAVGKRELYSRLRREMTVCIVFSPQLRQSTHGPRVTERLLESKPSASVLNRSSDRRPHPTSKVHAGRGRKGGRARRARGGARSDAAREREREREREGEGEKGREREREARRNG